MKNKLFAAIGTAFALWTAPPASAITIGFTPYSQSISVGSTATVDLFISGLGAGTAPSLGTFDLNIDFDPLVLSFTGASFGSQLDLFGLGNLRDVTPGVGSVNIFELSYDSPFDLDTLQADTFVLATLTFNALGSGVSPLLISANALGDSNGDSLAADLVATNISAVPEPETQLLMVIGIGMIALAMKRRNSSEGEQLKRK